MGGPFLRERVFQRGAPVSGLLPRTVLDDNTQWSGNDDSGVPPPGAQCFYGFAAKYGKLAVERTIDGQTGGVFTATLLDALKGGAAEEDGRITGETLKAYLYENMKEFLSPADLADKDIAKEPDLYCEPPEDQFVIANVETNQIRCNHPASRRF